MIKTDKFDVTQIPFNFVDNAAADEVIPLAHKHNMGFISMKPLGGGLLDNAGLCFRFLKQYEDIVPDPGIETLDEMEEIISIMDDPTPLTDEDKAEIERIKVEMGDKWCHRCEYCQPCPQDISIHMVLNLRSTMKRMSDRKLKSFMGPFVDKARDCTECGECMERCPYDLEVPNLLKENIDVWDEYIKTGKRP
jgi:predicted aldo/keto reductase-like oxidoreductase